MSASTRLTGNSSVSSLPISPLSPEPHLNTHSVQFYEDDAFLLDSLTKLIGTALVAGDAAIVIATPAHREALARRLRARGLDLEVAARAGRYHAIDAAGTLAGLMVHGAPNPARFQSFMGSLLPS